ncbi:hypothetical protein [Microcystis aeruginosa]|uniref:hypothetical protein n=1 Tax=Microcystis aeruginosa TaxID=1126 RepID=UPI001C1107C8|nr:hypothetical protein [Microcystis aeruginosa]
MGDIFLDEAAFIERCCDFLIGGCRGGGFLIDGCRGGGFLVGACRGGGFLVGACRGGGCGCWWYGYNLRWFDSNPHCYSHYCSVERNYSPIDCH